MMRLKCNLTVKETQSTTAKVLGDLKKDENENFNIEEIFKDKALKNENENLVNAIETSGINNSQNSEIQKTKT
jgi:hypothetical protein